MVKCKRCGFNMLDENLVRCPRCKIKLGEEVKTTVVHCKKQDFEVYVGRPSEWGNPFSIGEDGTREEVIQKYRRWIVGQPELLKKISTLRGKRLGCWCAGEKILTADKPWICHAQVLAFMADEKN